MAYQTGITNNPKGRPKGIKDKRHRYWQVRETLESMGLDPIVGLAKIAQDEGADPSHRLKALSELKSISYATLKSIEVKQDQNQHNAEMALLRDTMDSVAEQYKKPY